MRQFLNRMDSSDDEGPRRTRRRDYQAERDERRREERMADPLQLEHLRSHRGEGSKWTPQSLLPKSPWATASDPQPRPDSFKSMLEQRAEPKTPYYVTNTRRPPRQAQEEDEDEEDEEYFKARYEQENQEAEEIDLGPYFVYPKKKTFEKYFREFDFIKHVRHGTLSKFDGTIKGYPAFRKNFYELVYVQRVGYLHKLMALEYMVPETRFRKNLFRDLDNSAAHFGRRIKTTGAEVWGTRQTRTVLNRGPHGSKGQSGRKKAAIPRTPGTGQTCRQPPGQGFSGLPVHRTQSWYTYGI